MELRLELSSAVAGVAFDLDGTLVLSEERNRACWQAFFTARGIDFDDALAATVTGRRGADYFREAAHLFPGEDPHELVLEVLRYETELSLPDPEPVPGAVALVEHLAGAGLPLAVVTSRLRPSTEAVLAELGVRRHVPVLVTGEDVTAGKPDPEGYVRAGSLLGLPAEAVTVFEDSVAGVRAARAAGMYCVGVATHGSPGLLGEADAVVPDLTGVRLPQRRRHPGPTPTSPTSTTEETWPSAG
jgi:sugar-phosphatase